MSSPPSLKRSAAEAGLPEAGSSKKVKTLSPSDPLRLVTTVVLYDMQADLLELIFQYAAEEPRVMTKLYLTGIRSLHSNILPSLGPIFHQQADAEAHCANGNRFCPPKWATWQTYPIECDFAGSFPRSHEQLTPAVDV